MVSNDQNNMKSGIFERLFGKGALIRDKARLEAFVNALPGAYCGWGTDQTVAYNREFCRLLNLRDVAGVEDVADALTLDDAKALETAFQALNKHGEGFVLEAQTADETKYFRITGSKGSCPDQSMTVALLWLDDITEEKQDEDALRHEGEQVREELVKLQAAFDHVPFPVWFRDAAGEIVWCNKMCASVIGATPAEIVAEKKELAFKFPKSAGEKTSAQALAKAAIAERGVKSRVAHLIVDGARRLVDVSEGYIDATGGTLGTSLDITAVEQAETKLERYETANKELLEQLGTAVGIFDVAQRLEFYNPAFAQLWGLEDKYLNSKPKLGDVMEKLRETRRLPEQADFRAYKASWLEMFTRLIDPHEDMLYLPDGSALRMMVIPHPMGGLMMTFENVTSRLELESSYNTLIAVQKETLDNLAEGVVVFGGDGRVKLWNPSFAGQWGLNPEDLDSEPHVSQLALKMKKNFNEADWEENEQKIVAQSLNRARKEGSFELGDNRLLHYATMPLPDGGVLVTHVDVTDSAKVENALREKNAALEAAEQLKTDFLANVSYQLRTPLNAIMGFTEILGNEYFGPLNTRQKEYTANMKIAGERLLYLIDDILDLSTLEAGYMNLDYDAVDIERMLHNIYDLTIEWARKEGIELTVETAKNIGTMEADERRLKQVLLNLVRNAIAFTPQGGKITLQAAKEKEQIILTVSDTGPGIAEEDQKRIFEPFERLGSNIVSGNAQTADDQQDRGAGLGLSLVKNIVEMHNGAVELESRLQEGAVFKVCLPQKRQDIGEMVTENINYADNL